MPHVKVIAAYPTVDLAFLTAARLQSAGIAAEVRDDMTVSAYWLYGHALGGVRVAVPDEELDDALAILHMPVVEPGIIQCPHCGSRDVGVRPLSAMGALCLIFCLPLPLPLHTADCRSCGRSHDLKAHPQGG